MPLTVRLSQRCLSEVVSPLPKPAAKFAVYYLCDVKIPSVVYRLMTGPLAEAPQQVVALNIALQPKFLCKVSILTSYSEVRCQCNPTFLPLRMRLQIFYFFLLIYPFLVVKPSFGFSLRRLNMADRKNWNKKDNQ